MYKNASKSLLARVGTFALTFVLTVSGVPSATFAESQTTGADEVPVLEPQDGETGAFDLALADAEDDLALASDDLALDEVAVGDGDTVDLLDEAAGDEDVVELAESESDDPNGTESGDVEPEDEGNDADQVDSSDDDVTDQGDPSDDDANTSGFDEGGSSGDNTGDTEGDPDPRDIREAKIEIASATYTGEAIEPELTVTLDGVGLVENTDYELLYKNNIDAGAASVTVTGIGNYTGTVTLDFKITAAPASSLTLSGIENATYTGEAIEPKPIVTFGDTELVKDTDYTLSYDDNIDVGTASVTVTGKGNYAGTVTRDFEITAASAESLTLGGIKARTYTGKAQKPELTVTLGTKTLEKGKDYTLSYKNNTNAGTGTVTVTGTDNITGSTSKTFTINPASAESFTLSGVKASYVYTGNARKPTPTVKFGATTLKKGKDYSLSYKKNTNAGTATVTVTGKGNFTGSKEQTFTIKSASVASLKFSGIKTSYAYTGKAITPKPTVKFGTKKLTAGTDYTLTYKSNTKLGTAKITVKGRKNFSGTKTLTFRITKNVSKLTVVAPKKQIYTGKARKSAPVVKDGKTVLKAGTHYTLTYKNNVKPGTATVTIKGKGNYVGSRTTKFKITCPVSKLTVAAISAKTYTGSAFKPTPKVKLGTTVLKKGTHYTLSYVNNKKAGTAKVIIKGKGYYTGKVTKTFKIRARSIKNLEVYGPDDVTYNGKAQKPEPDVWMGDIMLKKGRDYTLAYKSNTNAGKATVTITGKGNFTGTYKTSFTIYKANASKFSVSSIGAQSYTGSPRTPAPTVKFAGKVLKRGQDYTLSYRNNTKAGTATVTVTGKGNFTGSVSRNFTIKAPAQPKPTPAPTPSPSVEATVYITNTGSKFHRDGCRYLSKSKIPMDRSTAVSQGYTPCSVCNP